MMMSPSLSPLSTLKSNTSSSTYREPSDTLKRLFLPPKDPSLALSSDYEWLIVTQEPPLPSIELLAKHEEKLAGLRFDPHLLAPSRMDYATSLAVQRVSTGQCQCIDLPSNSEGIRYVKFHPTRPYFVFASKVVNENRFELYKCKRENDGGDSAWSIREITLGGGMGGTSSTRRMNFINGCAYQFVGDDTDDLLVRVVPEDWPSSMPSEPVSTGPAIQAVEKGARKAPGRTYQDLLKNEHDAEKLRYFLTVEIILVDADPVSTLKSARLVPQSAGGRLVRDIQTSPCGRFVLAQTTTNFSYSVPIGRFGRNVEIWDLKSLDDAVVVGVASIPVDDEIPLNYDACSRHPRKFHFHPCKDHVVVYAVATDGGIGLSGSFEGERDALYVQGLDADTMTLGKPTKLIGLEWRYSDIDFTESGLGIVDEYRWNDRMERKWLIDNKTGGTKRLLWERSWEDRYTAPGEPLLRRGKRGQYFILQPTETSIYLQGAGASPLGDRPFFDLLDFSKDETMTKRLWRSSAPLEGDLDPSKEVNGVMPTKRSDVYESMICLLKDNNTIMISRESKTTPQNYFLLKLSDLCKNDNGLQITDFKHPQPDLIGITKELVQYKRGDGVELTANLYLPAKFDGTPRPTLFWAYPREFKDAKAAGQVKGSKHRFVSAHWASPIHWAAKGWVVMDDFSLPVIGEGDTQPNDTFIEQLVSGATAAVSYVTDRGVCDPRRCAVGGHSYGAFMTAHLLSHTSLFAAGISRSGAFNRTLTPMSFQSEERSIWEAPETYINMSPLMHVKKYSQQETVGKMLVIHGAADENDGTFPMQSERYFAALKAFGIESRLVILPHERHSYRARESILHMAWEQEEWLSSLEHNHGTGSTSAV